MTALEHIALYASDLEALRRFYQTYFGAESNDGYHNPNTGLRTYFLRFAGGARLEIMARPGTAKAGPPPQYPLGYVHIAFKLGSKEKVDALTARLAADGHTVAGQPRTTGDGYYESVVLDPEGNMVELVA